MENITEEIKYIGVYDKDMDLFENQYILKNGVTYNSYLIKDEKTVIMDTVDKRKTKEWLENLERELEGKNPDYLVISHLEPDHSGSIDKVLEKYPNLKIISNEKVFSMLPQFIDIDFEDRKVVVEEGDTFNTGKHTLQFFMMPMVHWPEVMVEYEQTEKILFSADAFGTFGSLEMSDNWKEEARRYYINIVGKYGVPVQNALNTLSSLDINMICPLHGPILKENLEYYIKLYDIWSKYEAEVDGTLIKMVIASSTYNMSIFPAINSLINLLKEKNYQNRKIGIIENGSWAPNAAKCIQNAVEQMDNLTIIEPIVRIKTRLNEMSYEKVKELAKNLTK